MSNLLPQDRIAKNSFSPELLAAANDPEVKAALARTPREASILPPVTTQRRPFHDNRPEFAAMGIGVRRRRYMAALNGLEARQRVLGNDIAMLRRKIEEEA